MKSVDENLLVRIADAAADLLRLDHAIYHGQCEVHELTTAKQRLEELLTRSGRRTTEPGWRQLV